MKARKLTSLILTFLMLFLLPASAMAYDDYYDDYGNAYGTDYDEPTDDYCPYSRSGTHDWSGWYIVREPSCTETGLERRICRNDCGWDQTEEIPALGHSYGSWETIQEADCSSEGEKERTCEVCGYTQTVYTDRLPHKWSSWKTTIEAGDYSAGQRSRTCTVCEETETQRFYPDGTIKRGDRGDLVKELQESLNAAGHDCGTADGIFGGMTEEAVKQFEEVNGLATDGIAWPGVINLLNGKTKNIPGSAPELKLSGGQVQRKGDGFSEIILIDMTLDNIGDAPLSVSIESESWAGDPVADVFLGWPDDSLELQPGETFAFQYQISPTENDLDVGYIHRFLNVIGHDEEHDLFISDSFLTILPIYGEADTGRIQLSTVNVLREGAGEDTVITAQLAVADLGKTDLDVWVRSSDSNGEVPSGDAFTDWPENGEGSELLTPGDSKVFSYVVKPSAKDLQEGRITRTVTAEGIDPESGQGFVSHVDLNFALSGTDPTTILHVNYHGGPGHEENHFYQSGELLHLDYTVNNYSNVELRNARLLYEVLSADGTCLYKDMSFTGEYGEILDAPMFGGMLLYTLTDEAAENGPLTVLCWAEAERTDAPGEIVRSENIWRTQILTGDENALSGDTFEGGIGGPGDEETEGGEKKWKGRIYVSASAEDKVYSENESIDVTITITNAGEEPVADLMGQIYVLGAPDFTSYQELESEAPVYDDLSVALAPEDSVSVTMTHVVTKEEAASGHVYLAARAEGHSTGVHSYCADTAVLSLSASSDSSSDEAADGSEETEGDEETGGSKKWKGRIYVSASAEDRIYSENESIDVTITIKNAGEEPVADLMGQIYVLGAPDFTSYQELESEAPVYDDLSTALAPEDSVSVTMTHVVTKEEAASGHVYLAARAEGHSTGVHSYCADTAVLSLSTSSDNSSDEGGIGGPGDEETEGGEKKWKGRIYVSAYAEDKVYSENESINVTITIKNVGEEPVADLMGQIYVMEDPYFEGYIQLESEAPVYDDLSTALAPEDSVSVTMTHVVTKQEAANGHVYLAARADGHSTGVHSYCADTAVLSLSASSGGSSDEAAESSKETDSSEDTDGSETDAPETDTSETDTSEETDGGKKWKGRIYVSADAEDRVYSENESIDITITIKNAGEEPVADLMGQIYVMEDPYFMGYIQLESEKPVYDDLSTALAPEDTVSVTMTHVVTKEEAASGHIYLAARADGHSTGVHSYCADTAVLTLTASSDDGTDESGTESIITDLPPLKADASLEITIALDMEYYVPRVPVNYEVTVHNTGTVTVNDIKPSDPDGENDCPDVPAFSLMPGETHSFDGTVTISLEEGDMPHDYGWNFTGDVEKSGEQITGLCKFTLVPAGMLYRDGKGLRIQTEAENKIYSKDETAVLKMCLENIADEPIEDVHIILRRADPDDHSKTTECTKLHLDGVTVQPKEKYMYDWEYVITDSDEGDGVAPLICYVTGRNAVTGQVLYDYFSYDLYTQ